MSNNDELLSFKEFPPVHENHSRGGAAQININSPKHNNYNSDDPLQDLISDMSMSVKVLENNDNFNQESQEQRHQQQPNEQKGFSFLSIEYYQQFFDVDTVTVVDRIATSMIPKRAPMNYLKSVIGLNPDFYGPFWIVVTLIFSIAISGNLASYLQNANNKFHWHYNFHLVSYAATTIIMYSLFIPFSLWGALKWSLIPIDPEFETETNGYTPTLMSLICIYGYSLAIYVPVSILWVIQISLLQWLLVITAALLSGSVLIFVLMPALKNSRFSLFLIIGIIMAHFLLAAGFMVYFFHVPNTEAIKQITTTIANIIKPDAKVSATVA